MVLKVDLGGMQGALLTLLNHLSFLTLDALIAGDQVRKDFTGTSEEGTLRFYLSRDTLEQLKKENVRFASLGPKPKRILDIGPYTVTGERLCSESNEVVLIFRIFRFFRSPRNL